MIPTRLPAVAYCGDTLRARVSFPDASSETHSLTLYLTGPTGVTAPGVADGTAWIVGIAAEDTESLPAGRYGWFIRTTADADDAVFTVATGTIELLANPLDADPPLETRSFARRALEALETAILEKDAAATSYSVFGRTYSFSSHSELLAARERLRREVAAEDEAARRAAGEPSRRTVWTRF